jgi:hypothetical protein
MVGLWSVFGCLCLLMAKNWPWLWMHEVMGDIFPGCWSMGLYQTWCEYLVCQSTTGDGDFLNYEAKIEGVFTAVFCFVFFGFPEFLRLMERSPSDQNFVSSRVWLKVFFFFLQTKRPIFFHRNNTQIDMRIYVCILKFCFGIAPQFRDFHIFASGFFCYHLLLLTLQKFTLNQPLLHNKLFHLHFLSDERVIHLDLLQP